MRENIGKEAWKDGQEPKNGIAHPIGAKQMHPTLGAVRDAIGGGRRKGTQRADPHHQRKHGICRRKDPEQNDKKGHDVGKEHGVGVIGSAIEKPLANLPRIVDQRKYHYRNRPG